MSGKTALQDRLRKRSEALASGTSQPLEENGHLIAPQQRTLTLSSGRVITLKLHIFNGKEEIETFTRIDSSNIREQSWLNEKSLSDILPTIAAMQLYPAIGYSDTDNHILIVDGSRRRAAAILKDCSYFVEVSDQPLTKREAKEIVDLSDKKKKFTDFEWGKFYSLKMAETNLTQKQFAEGEGISEATLSRYINAYNVDERLYTLFLDKDEINSAADSQRLIKINRSIKALNEDDIEDFVLETYELIESKISECQNIEEHKILVFSCLESVLKKKQAKVGRQKKSVEPIALFSGEKNNEFIRYHDDSPHKSTITLSRINAEKREKIKILIQQIMQEE